MALAPVVSPAGADDRPAAHVAPAFNVMAAPSFAGLIPRQVYSSLDTFAKHYKGVLADVDAAAAAGTITSARAGQVRATVGSQVARLNANYFAWRDAYNASQNGTGANSGSGSGSGGSGGEDSGEASDRDSGPGAPNGTETAPAGSPPPPAGSAGSSVQTPPAPDRHRSSGREITKPLG
ncbi:MAG: hypothetical protein WBK99_08230, partial [Solirubrobacterales bacterium]